MSKEKRFLLSKSVWIFSDTQDSISVWVKEQIMKLVQELCGVAPVFSKVLPRNRDSLAIIVGTTSNSQFINDAVEKGLIVINQLAGDDHIIKQTSLNSRDVLIISGQNERAVMYGVFEFFEQLSCLFLISRDVLPETNPQLIIPFLNILRHTENHRRGLWLEFCSSSSSIWSISDYYNLFDQMVKMKLNYLSLYFFEHEPFIDYSYNGERKVVGDISDPESGYIAWRALGGSYLVKDIPVGKEKFSRKRVAPLEFQEVNSSSQALDTGKDFIRTIIDLARKRGIKTWISFLPTFVSMNISKYTRRMPRPHSIWSGLVSFSDPNVDEINRNRLQNIMDSYPNAEGIFLGIPEGFYEDPYPDSQKFIKKEWSKYQEALELQKKYWGKFWPTQALQEAHIRADIGFVEIIKHTIKIAKEINPDIKLGIVCVCKAYLLTHLHKILPKEIVFIDIESRSLWTLDGAPLHLFKKMRGRRCIIIPRAVDDGSLAGLQFNLNLYDKDRYCFSARENGTDGLAIQTTHIRGNEHNVKYLADGMWNVKLTPKQFYKKYSEIIFGPQAAKLMIKAFLLLEENEEFLGGRGLKNMPFNTYPQEIFILKKFKTAKAPFFEAPFSKEFVEDCKNRAEKFGKALQFLSTAKNLFCEALKQSRGSGKRELMYLIRKTQGYIDHLNTLTLLTEGYSKYFDAFTHFNKNITSFKEELRTSLNTFSKAEEMAIKTAEHFAECTEHPSDLGVLWMINSSMVIGTKVLRQYISNVVAFYDGQEYWKNIEWKFLFQDIPFPVCDAKIKISSNSFTYEPG